MKHKIKLFIILGVEFLVIISILLMIFLAGKQTYTVRFELNGGTLISGSVEQNVTRGKNANPPTVTKDGCYLLKWSNSYNNVTKDMVVEAVWEYETSCGITYNTVGSSNYCMISGSYEDIGGAVYIGAYRGDVKVLGIEEGAFENRTRITSVHLLDGILSIEDNAFAGCTSLETIILPSTLVRLGDNVFKDCVNLKTVVYSEPLDHMTEEEADAYLGKAIVDLPYELERMGDNVFSGCTLFEEIYIPESVKIMGSNVFEHVAPIEPSEPVEPSEPTEPVEPSEPTEPTEPIAPIEPRKLKIYVYTLTAKPEGWMDDWYLGEEDSIVWGYTVS